MEFKKCVRCGCFFSTEDAVCPNCKTKDEIDKKTIKNYMPSANVPENIEALSSISGVSVKNINRFLENEDFSKIKKQFSKVSEPIEIKKTL